MAKLKALQVDKLGPGRHADGDGLYLLVKPSGARSWLLRVQNAGRRRDFGLGPISRVSLSEARKKARAFRQLAHDGVDPRQGRTLQRTVSLTFEEAARQCHATLKRGWRNGKHQDQWLSTLERHAFPKIGARSIDEIDAAAILSVLRPIWLETPETGRRVRQRIGSVLNYAHAEGWRPTEAPMKAVAMGLARQSRKVRHFAALPYAHLAALMIKLDEEEPTAGRLALRFAILTAARSGEVRGARWSEIDWEAKQWNIGGNRMKAGEDHSVPLSEPALAILRQAEGLRGLSDQGWLFPGLKGGRLSDATMRKALRKAGVSDTVHGMRSAFRDWAGEQAQVPDRVAEAALSHSDKDRVQAAYLRTRYLEQRRGLMADWGAFVGGGNVVDIRRRA